MEKRKVLPFPTKDLPLGVAVGVVKFSLDDSLIPLESKIVAIEKVANMETHNSITKDELVAALRWIFEHYDFSEG